MAGSGGINYTKAAVEFFYDGSSAEEGVPVTVVAVNLSTDDVGEKKDTNRGLVSFTYPSGFEGDDHITVVDDATGETIAEFDTGFFKVP